MFFVRASRFPAPYRQLFILLAVSALDLSIVASAHAATYYIAPNGSNSGVGDSGSPWKTFPHAISKLNPGDTLVLKDGNYTHAANGSGSYIVLATCGSNAKSGTPGAPITIRAENERQARLKSNAGSVMRFTKCSYWNVIGLTLTGADNAAVEGNGFVGIYESDHFEIKRNIFANSNRWYNMCLMDLVNSGYVLLEENEFYNFHRHAITGAGAWNVTARRNYANGRDYPDVGKMLDTHLNSGNPEGGDVLFEMYPARDSIIENNISENNMGVLGMPASGRYGVEAMHNGLFGNISLNDDMGAKSDARHPGLFGMPHNNTYVDLVVINPRTVGTFHRAAKDQLCLNCSVFGGDGGFSADDNPAGEHGDGVLSVYYENVLAVGEGGGYGINSVRQSKVEVKNANITNYSSQFSSPGTGTTNYSGIRDENPGLGSCKVFIPDGSPMKGAGTNGNDIGANVLCRYENGVLQTNTLLWYRSTGSFPCGAIVHGINDIAGSSCFDVHKRLNVNSNGCNLPATPVCKQPQPTIIMNTIGGGAGASGAPVLLGPNGEMCPSPYLPLQ